MHGFCQMDEHHDRFLSLINDNLKVTLNVYTTSDSEMIIFVKWIFLCNGKSRIGERKLISIGTQYNYEKKKLEAAGNAYTCVHVYMINSYTERWKRAE